MKTASPLQGRGYAALRACSLGEVGERCCAIGRAEPLSAAIRRHAAKSRSSPLRGKGKRGYMLEKLTTTAEQRSAEAVARQIDRLLQAPTPPGITAEATDSGMTLIGKRLRQRMLIDANLRNFGR